MLKEACAVSALVAAALVPSMPSQAQAANAGATTSSIDSSSSLAPKCKWLQEGDRRCYYCRAKKGSGYKRQYCERRRGESHKQGSQSRKPMDLECVTTKKPTTNSPNRTCKVCTDASTGKRAYQECDS
ncbi:hypothetical protein AB0K40_15005 [Nonomuraea bangladeshensis]|uniref:Uncharacterized protein n=1 Tax=Nonomuraea bangladeshensis TaxID=404385 RepID=A0ABV3H3Q8_9ACTN